MIMQSKILLASSLIAVSVMSAGASAADCPINPQPSNVQKILKDILAKDGQDWDKVSWDFFVAINQPATTGSSTLIWETMRQTADVYLDNGATPNTWNNPPPTPTAVCDAAKAIAGMDLSRPFHNFDANRQADGLAFNDNPAALSPLASATRPPTAIRYQMLMDGVTLGYIQEKQLYNMDGVTAFAKAGKAASFPENALEFKSSAIWIGNDTKLMNNLKGIYQIVNAYYSEPDATGKTTYKVGWAAITGMHVTFRPLSNPDWVWLTFENMQNGTYTAGGLQLPIPPAAQALNTAYQTQLAGTVLANYQLDGSQTLFIQDQKPTLLANSQIESAFQRTSSCITCHGTASYSPEKGWYNFVPPADQELTYPVGNLPSLAGYTSLDFVWSIRRAQWKR